MLVSLSRPRPQIFAQIHIHVVRIIREKKVWHVNTVLSIISYTADLLRITHIEIHHQTIKKRAHTHTHTQYVSLFFANTWHKRGTILTDSRPTLAHPAFFQSSLVVILARFIPFIHLQTHNPIHLWPFSFTSSIRKTREKQNTILPVK